MATYICPVCGEPASAGENHICKSKAEPFNVIMTEEDKEKFKGGEKDER